MPRELLVFGNKTFRIVIPDDAKVTFGPFSPPSRDPQMRGYGNHPERAIGTLRIYKGTKSTENILACFAGVSGFRDLSLDYMEEVAKEEGATIWNSDQHGYKREEKVSRRKEWVEPALEIESASDDDGEVAF